jgi:hypothetical protein
MPGSMSWKNSRVGSWKMVLVRARWAHWLWLLAMPAAAGENVADKLEVDAEFLEYLGSWQDTDEDWIAVSEWEETGKQEAAIEQEREDDEQGG